ncbi:MAG: transcriptional regulator [Acidiferrobacterales bacterium]
MKILGKSSIIGLLFIGATLATTVYAQGSYEQFKGEIELTRAMAQLGREVIVERNMQLNREDSNKFWPVYNDYRGAIDKVNDRRIKLITSYADSYNSGNLSDDKALGLLNEFLSIEKARLKVKKKYVPRFKKVLPPKKVVRFFQVDNKLDAIVKMEMARNIPLVQ